MVDGEGGSSEGCFTEVTRRLFPCYRIYIHILLLTALLS